MSRVPPFEFLPWYNFLIFLFIIFLLPSFDKNKVQPNLEYTDSGIEGNYISCNVLYPVSIRLRGPRASPPICQ